MSSPYDQSQWGQQPQQGYGQPSYQPTTPQPSWDNPQGYGQPSYEPTSQQPAWNHGGYDQQQHHGQYDQGQYGQHQGWYDPQPYGQPNQPASKGRGKLIAASAAVVVLAGGGVATYAAVSSSESTGGASSPRGAVDKLVTDINNNDLIGVLEDLPPGERDAITKPFLDTIDQLKRTEVLRKDADLHKPSGFEVAATNLTFGTKTVTINDHVQVVEVTGGKVHVSADAARLPFTTQFLNLAAPRGLKNARVDSTVDIGSKVRSSGKPLRIATQKVDGRWYPSLFYSAADNAVQTAHLSTPTTPIPANGASSADEAVRQWIEALLQGQVQRAIELSSPAELAVLHDYGSIIVDKLNYSGTGVQIKGISFSDKSISGGTRVSLKEIDLSVSNQTATVKIEDDCVVATVNGSTKRFCGSSIGDFIGQSGMKLTAEQSAALSRAFSSISKIGLDTSQTGGKWYVNPVRSYFDVSATVLSGLQPGDLLTIIGALRDR